MIRSSLFDQSQLEQMIQLRRQFHRHPELAHQEQWTAGVVASRLRDLGLDNLRTNVGTTGVVATLRGGVASDKTVLLRADMDALPLIEADRGQPYRSEIEGAHHACGHDGHMAILLGVAELFAQQRETLPGTVVFLFQPAEEQVGGAEKMIQGGALEDPRPDVSFALHLWNSVPVGRVEVRPGPVFAAADAFNVRLTGPGGHGAMPHETADPVVAAAHLITALQLLVSREMSPLDPSALTIGSIHGGTVHNIIPSRVDLQGTLRTYDEADRQRLLRRIDEMVRGISGTLRVQGEFQPLPGCPPCVNDPAATDLVRQVAAELLGAESVGSDGRTMGADDMALFLREIPGCYFKVGSANRERRLDSPHHSPTFDFDEGAIEIGANLLARVTLDYLHRA